MSARRLDDDLLLRLREATLALDRSLARSAGTVEETQRLRRRSELLRRFVERVRSDPDHLVLHCSWCGRVAVGDEFVAPEEFLAADLPERLRARATHGICPDCFDRAQHEADEVRTGRKSPGSGSS